MFPRGCGFSLYYWLFGTGWCLLENLCTRFYTKLVCCYETDPMSLVNWRHFVLGRSSARSSCGLFPNTGNLSEKWEGGGGCLRSTPLELHILHRGGVRSRSENSLLFVLSVSHFRPCLISWRHRSTIHVPVESPLRICRAAPPPRSFR